MAVEFVVRLTSPVDYEFWEARTETIEELVEAERVLRDHRAEQTGSPDEAERKAIGTLHKGGAVGGLPGLKKGGGSFKGKGSFKGRSEAPAEVNLGVSELTGEEVIVITKGKYGPWLKSGETPQGKIFSANLPKGMSWEQVDLDKADELLQEKYEYLVSKGQWD